MSDEAISHPREISHRRKEEGEPVGDGACPAYLLGGFTQPRQGLGAPCRPVAKLFLHLQYCSRAQHGVVQHNRVGDTISSWARLVLHQRWVEGEAKIFLRAGYLLLGFHPTHFRRTQKNCQHLDEPVSFQPIARRSHLSALGSLRRSTATWRFPGFSKKTRGRDC